MACNAKHVLFFWMWNKVYHNTIATTTLFLRERYWIKSVHLLVTDSRRGGNHGKMSRIGHLDPPHWTFHALIGPFVVVQNCRFGEMRSQENFNPLISKVYTRQQTQRDEVFQKMSIVNANLLGHFRTLFKQSNLYYDLP
jgi:hypothetical protein